MGTLILGAAGAAVRRPWHDELYTLELARRPARAILEALRLDSGPPGHYLLAHAVTVAGLDGILWLRLASVLAVAVGVALLTGSAERRWGTRPAWMAAGLLAVHPVVLLAAVEARAYGVLFLCAAVAAVMLRDELSRRETVLLATALAAGCWVHALGVVLCVSIIPAGILLGREARLRIWEAAAAALALQLPWIPVMVHQPPEALAWMARVVREAGPRLVPVPLAAASPLMNLSPWLDVRAAFPGTGLAASLLGFAVVLIAFRHPDRRPLALFWAGAAAMVLAASFLLRPVYFPGRSDVLWVGAAVVLTAVLLARLGKRGVVVALALVAAGSAGDLKTLALWKTRPEGPAATAARVLKQVVRPGDVVVTTGWWGLDVRWAMGPAAQALVWRTFPPAARAHPGWYSDREADAASAGRLLHELLPEASSGQRIWLLRSPPLPSDRFLDGLVTALHLEPIAAGGPLWQLWGPHRHGAKEKHPG